MGQMGMQMQGGGMRKRGASPDVYTGLAFIALAALIAACVFVYLGAAKVGVDGSPFGMQDKTKISLSKPVK